MQTVLHIVKTADGARWACAQVAELVALGIDVHVVLPVDTGAVIDEWHQTGARLHYADLSLPVKRPWKLVQRIKSCRELVESIKPDIVHTHFVTNTLLVRMALRGKSNICRIFQVPGPLHMEHWFFRRLELLFAQDNDYWICTSQFIRGLYEAAGIGSERLFLSYAAFTPIKSKSSYPLRSKHGIDDSVFLLGNVSYMYKPKWYLGQKLGLKRHEDMIASISRLSTVDPEVELALVGAQWGVGTEYEERLRSMAAEQNGAVHFVGRLGAEQAYTSWRHIDCALHIPNSENCGGVIEAFFNEVPVIASDTGGLPEVVIPGKTGWLVPVGDVSAVVQTVLEVRDNYEKARRYAVNGKRLVQAMFDIKRTSKEVQCIYVHLGNEKNERPRDFNPEVFLDIAEASS